MAASSANSKSRPKDRNTLLGTSWTWPSVGPTRNWRVTLKLDELLRA
jgi:hypothetical protein